MSSLIAPTSLLFYETLNTRKNLSPKEKRHYEQVHKGFIGEVKLGKVLENNHYNNIIPLFGNLFSIDDTEFQIDCILVTNDTFFLLEVKNYSGDYYLKDNHLYHLPSKKQIYNPLNQIDRAELLFKRMLEDMKIHCKVHSYVVFVSKYFFLYEATPSLPMIFPGRLKSFLKRLNANVQSLNHEAYQRAEVLSKAREKNSAYERLPDYDLAQLKRGVFCPKCNGELLRIGRRRFSCSICEWEHKIHDVVLYAIAQFHLLFPEEKIMTEMITQWCGHLVSKGLVRAILQEYFSVIENGSHTHYHFPNKEDHINLLAEKYK